MRKIALITGASKRIGKALAEHLAEKGWNIAIHFNSSKASAIELAKLLSEKYPEQKFETFKCNLAAINQVVELIPSVIKAFGNIDLLINNASVFESGYLKETTLELYENQLNVNLKAPFFLIRDFSNHSKLGNVINFVDTRVTTNKSDFAAYSLSKKGLWDLTKMAALELAPNIRVNAIAPGVTLPPDEKDESYLMNLAKKIPMRKPGGIAPIIKSLDYILENDHVTGQLLFADGGENLGINV